VSEVIYRKQNDRTGYIGASEAPAILGLSNWATPFDVWARKTQPQEEFTGNAATKRGHILEGAVFDWGCGEVGAVFSERGGDFNSLPIQGPRPWAAFHPDGWLIGEDGERYVVEVKTARDGNGWEDGGIPAVYMGQVRYQLACCPPEIAGAWVFAYITFKDEFLTRYVERDEAQETAMLDICGEWWDAHVVANVPPAFDGSDGANTYLANTYPNNSAPLDKAGDDEKATLDELMSVRAELTELKTQDRRLSQILKDHIGDRDGVYIEGVGKATWKSQKGRAGFDSKRFAAERPELHAEYATTGKPTRVLRLPKAVK
jgi:putative phage-type endonuclease